MPILPNSVSKVSSSLPPVSVSDSWKVIPPVRNLEFEDQVDRERTVPGISTSKRCILRYFATILPEGFHTVLVAISAYFCN